MAYLKKAKLARQSVGSSGEQSRTDRQTDRVGALLLTDINYCMMKWPLFCRSKCPLGPRSQFSSSRWRSRLPIKTATNLICRLSTALTPVARANKCCYTKQMHLCPSRLKQSIIRRKGTFYITEGEKMDFL